MAYPTPQEIAAKAAEKGFRVGAYVHMSTATTDTAAPIREFSSLNGQVQAVWMGGACRNLLGELRLSSQHRLPYQFPAGYEFFTSPQLVAEASRQAGISAATAGYTAARVKGYGSADTDTWVTTDPNPQGEGAVFVSLRQQPAEAPAPDLSPSMEILVGGQLVTAADVAHWMNADPKQGKKLFKEMQGLYGAKPTMLDLAMFSGATMLAPVAASVVAARRKAVSA
ncbi:hypothetical protein E4631_23440 [Hymenobacter sp. UV11]|uniref:hypothetical protein n=1 Tax=Hymenobacter sp. UV11 TaxID=1849735 RepID=UPI00105D8179|nr:hypothetical protein [Hymenobacter sp. UV11]TDN39882.1 hypothetical protein A8B98_16630 [Hymenobacter sp. UV11]TFZ63261.1 hypothetical protein E4631_23440 [Hymenobacter sp. UV11]